MTKKEAQERILKLRKEIDHHRYLYHVLDREEISDVALDSLKHELARIEKEFPELITPDSPTQRVAGALLPGFKKVRHETAMLSLNDAFSEEELKEWEGRIKILTGRDAPEYFAEIKVDGFAVSLLYENGVLVNGSTRGDGVIGEDVTDNLKTIESIPLRLQNPAVFMHERDVEKILKKFPRAAAATAATPRRLEVRGEVYMTKKAFEEVNREQDKKGEARFANPRNIAAGSVRQLDPKITAARKLDFLAYDLVADLGQETHEEEHVIAKLFGFKTMGLAEICRDTDAVMAFWKRVHAEREKLPLLIDGIVVQVNSGTIFDRLGIVGKAPRGAVAFKFPAKEATTIVKSIIIQIGRTGVLTPVAALEPVSVGGVTVSRATLHNMDEIERLGVRIGDTVILQRAGDVIPDVVRVLKDLRPRRAKKFRMPRMFCGQSVIRRRGEVAHRILHPEKCELVTREKLYHFVSKGAFDIQGLGPKIIDGLYDEGLVSEPADLFLITERDIEEVPRFAEKSAQNLVRSIQAKKEIEFPRFIYALGILHVGEETALDLARHFGAPKNLERASLEELIAVPNIGDVVARSIYEWFKNNENRGVVKRLLQAGVKVKSVKMARGKLRGVTFLLTGGLEVMTRDEAKRRIREHGGDIAESVSKKIGYVVAGSRPGSKLERAKKLGIKIIDEKELIRVLK